MIYLIHASFWFNCTILLLFFQNITLSLTWHGVNIKFWSLISLISIMLKNKNQNHMKNFKIRIQWYNFCITKFTYRSTNCYQNLQRLNLKMCAWLIKILEGVYICIERTTRTNQSKTNKSTNYWPVAMLRIPCVVLCQVLLLTTLVSSAYL